MLIDTHAHLDLPEFDDDREKVIDRALSAGVERIVNPGINLDSSRRAAALAERYDGVFAAVGIHPSDVDSFDESTVGSLRDLAKKTPKVVAIGETGLDFYRDYHPRELQEKVFRAHIGLALELELPLVIHSRGAEERVVEILKEERGGRVGGVLHCWGGTEQTARKGHKLGFLLGFGGTLTYKKSTSLDVALALPVDWIVLETDAPYLPPVPYRGKRNEPAYVAHTAQFLADASPLSLDDILRITGRNASKLFALGGEEPSRIAYTIRDSRYLNITSRCTLACTFCPKFDAPVVKGHNLELVREPSVDEIVEAVGDPAAWEEVVFCGFGESTLRLDVMLEVAALLKELGAKSIRLDTDGLANFVYEKDITPRLAGLIDSVSVSLNAPDQLTYSKLCLPGKPGKSWEGVVEFIRAVKAHVPKVTATVIDFPNMDIEACRQIVEDDLGVEFRVRNHDALG